MQTSSLMLVVVGLVGALVALGGGHAWLCRRDERRAALRQAIHRAIMEYFQISEVTALAFVTVRDDRSIAVMVEAEPLAKFRFSYIIEESLRKHVHKVTGAHVAAVFWRFPIAQKPAVPAAGGEAATATERPAPQAPRAADAEAPPAPPPPQPTPAEEILRSRGHTGYEIEVEEASWETFQAAMRETASAAGKESG